MCLWRKLPVAVPVPRPKHWQKYFIQKVLHSVYCTNPGPALKHTTLATVKAKCFDDSKCEGVVDWHCNDDGDYSLCPKPERPEPVYDHDPNGPCIYSKDGKTKTHKPQYCKNSYGLVKGTAYTRGTTLSHMKAMCLKDPGCGGVVDWHCNDDGDYAFCPVKHFGHDPHGSCVYMKQ